MDLLDQENDLLKELTPLIPHIKNMVLAKNTNDDLINAINENTKICRELLDYIKENNVKTNKIHRKIEAWLSPDQQAKDFGINLIANIIGNAIDTPRLINIGNKT